MHYQNHFSGANAPFYLLQTLIRCLGYFSTNIEHVFKELTEGLPEGFIVPMLCLLCFFGFWICPWIKQQSWESQVP